MSQPQGQSAAGRN